MIADFSTADAIAAEDAATLPTYAKPPVALVRGEGAYVWDTDGNRYLDLYGGHCVALLGHSPPRVADAIAQQAQELLFYSNAFYSPVRAEASERLVGLADGFDRVFWCSTGTEANETALKLARAQTGRAGIVAVKGGFHGRTLGSLAVTWGDGYQAPYRSVLPKTTHVPFGWEGAVEEALAGGDVAAVILEPIQSMAGVFEAPPAYYQALRRLCDQHGTFLIFDEVQTGVGRTGRFLYGEHVGVQPDLVTLAKSLGSGVPVGAVLCRDSVAEQVKPGDQGTTFGGGPLAMAAASATLQGLVEDDLMTRATRLFELFEAEMNGVEGVVEVRGRGGLIGIQLGRPAKPVGAALRARGILVGSAAEPHTLRLMPPLVTPPAAAAHLAEALRAVLAAKRRA